ncbi:HAD family hydrolase [Halieaceae bacterium IMCC14734]|uniref:3-deoxy-D-manno-octulosonate 8-phosphate phosphatase KdsC n=1 Tax=Candidatus Litorirhabdus singularis TaxID=2518993 RepID=A0ABT3TM27_9GAMM|nr:HAD hydrolase family protein [Candidatus Litorirhabdus singularis]MCX2982454.1 HAD family hydrolase [Candidatus Litorirhabdus singularis]
MSAPTANARRIRLLVLDVDGILSNGLLIYGNQGEEMKTFHTEDGLGIKLLQRSGIEVAIITGRESAIVARRASELGIERLIQGREDKLHALRELVAELEVELHEVAYMGDDLPDLAAIAKVGLGMTVASANPFVKEHALWCSQRSAGRGAVREAAEFILQAQGKLDDIRQRYLSGEPG